jgi:hypothetical protein
MAAAHEGAALAAAQPGADDPVLESLDMLLAAARANIASWIVVMERAEGIRDQRRRGMAYSEMQIEEPGRPIIDVVARNQERLTIAAAGFRRALAHQLVAEGWSLARIGRVFGVSRQRVANLVRPDGSAISAVLEAVPDQA